MNARRQKLAQMLALQAAAAKATGEHPIADLQAYPLREPGSGRAYTVVRIRTRTGLTGWGECGVATAADIEKARSTLTSKPATAYAVLRSNTPLDGGIDMALLDITAKACSAPVHRLLGGPTRFKVRSFTALTGTTDAELAAAAAVALKSGYRALGVPLPAAPARNQGQAFDRAVRARMEALGKSTGEGVDLVIDGASSLTAGDAGSVAATLERFRPLWFDEPCAATNLRTIQKISGESVTPLGFGRHVRESSLYQDLLREGAVDILRPGLHQNGISRIRQIATLAETYYVAVAPFHDGGPVATAAALHLAASLPNFFIQQIPLPAADADRRMRAEIATTGVETVRDGFASLPSGAGLGIEVNEQALEKYKDNR